MSTHACETCELDRLTCASCRDAEAAPTRCEPSEAVADAARTAHRGVHDASTAYMNECEVINNAHRAIDLLAALASQQPPTITDAGNVDEMDDIALVRHVISLAGLSKETQPGEICEDCLTDGEEAFGRLEARLADYERLRDENETDHLLIAKLASHAACTFCECGDGSVSCDADEGMCGRAAARAIAAVRAEVEEEGV